jgi:hypothetical protein
VSEPGDVDVALGTAAAEAVAYDMNDEEKASQLSLAYKWDGWQARPEPARPPRTTGGSG